MKKKGRMNKYVKFLIYLVVVVLINIAGMTLFFRADLTADNAYSLSEASRKVVGTLSEPLTIKVFFTRNLPAPYNNIGRYLHDLLEEYALAGNRFFNYEFYDISSEEDERSRHNQETARSYGIQPVQIQVLEHDEMKFQMAYMGMVLIHGDLIETFPAVTSTDQLEYQMTSKIRKMNNKISALLRLKDKIQVKLFVSSSLQAVGPYMNLTALRELPGKIKGVVDQLNEKNYGRLSFSHLDPSANPADEEEVNRYNILSLQWKEFTDARGETIPADKGYAGLIVEHGRKVEEMQLIKVFRLPIFGTQYQITDPEELRETLNKNIENVMDINQEIGYLADHGTPSLQAGYPGPEQPDRETLSHFENLLAEDYSVTPVRLKESGIPDGLSFLILAGPAEPFTDYELYQIDQFLMKGNSLAIFLDAFNEVMPQDRQSMMMGQQPAYPPLHTGLEKLLTHYGIAVKPSYVLDENCFKQRVVRSPGGGERPIYFAPIIKNERINKTVDYLKNIKGLVMLKASPLEVDDHKVKENGLKAVKLLSSSDRSWEMAGRIDLNPMFMAPPTDEDAFKSRALAYTLEGAFPSYFADKPIPVKEEDTSLNPAAGDQGANKETVGRDMSRILSQGATLKKGKPARIFLIGTSEVLKDNILDEDGRNTNSQFVMNVVDYLNGREENAVMRSKTQQFNPVREIAPAARAAIKTGNIAGLPVLVILSGLVVWFRRSSRKRVIQEIFRK